MGIFNYIQSPTGKKYVSAFITEIFVVVCSVLLYRICLMNYGESDFSVYSIYRRGFSFLQPLLMIGLGVGIPRYVSIYFQDREKVSRYYSAATLIIFGVCVFSSMILIVFASSFSSWLFGYEFYRYLIPPLVLMLNGVLLYNISYSYFRGVLNMAMANVFQIIFLGLIPILTMTWTRSLENYFYWNGILWMAFALIGWIIGYVYSGRKFKIEIACIKELLKYGLYRLPGDIGLGFFFLFPVMVVLHQTHDTILAGYVAFAITLINLVGSFFTPICVVLLAQSGNLIAERKYEALKNLSIKLTILVFGLVVPGILVFEFFTEWILELYLSSVNDTIIQICRIIFLSSLGYALYIALRSIPDALFVKPINSLYILISMLVFGLICLYDYTIGHDTDVLLSGFVFSLSLLGVLTMSKTFVSLNHLIRKEKL